VCENGGKHVELIAHTRGDRHIVHLAVRLEFGKDPLLRPTTLVEPNDLAYAGALVGNDDLEVVAVLCGLEEVELNGCLVLAPDLFANEEEAVGRGPGLGFPLRLEEAQLAVQAAPSFPPLYDLLEFREALEWDRDGEFDLCFLKLLRNGLVEEGAVDTRLDFYPGLRRTHAVNAPLNEGIGTIAVVDVAGSVVNIEDLVGLSDGTEKGMLAQRKKPLGSVEGF